MVDRFQAWGERSYGPAQRTVALGLQAILFMWLIPAALTRSARAIERRLPRLAARPHPFARWTGALAMGAGWLLAMWAIGTQLKSGRGTPAPLMPTQSLVQSGPYAHSRNPMALGTALCYLGLAAWRGSCALALLVLGLAGLLLAYIKGVEERELAARFGEPYLAYRRQTPFLFPRLAAAARIRQTVDWI